MPSAVWFLPFLAVLIPIALAQLELPAGTKVEEDAELLLKLRTLHPTVPAHVLLQMGNDMEAVKSDMSKLWKRALNTEGINLGHLGHAQAEIEKAYAQWGTPEAKMPLLNAKVALGNHTPESVRSALRR